MKKAVATHEPLMETRTTGGGKGTLVVATVKGDVHDIGKNIVGVVLRCNGWRVVDLGVMVPAHQILDAAVAEKANAVGLSGLITPSLDEMVHVAGEMQRRGMQLPLLIGGATTSGKHTAVKIAPAYTGTTVHVRDASLAVGVVGKLLGGDRAEFARDNAVKQEELRRQHRATLEARTLVPIAEARKRRTPITWRAEDVPAPAFTGLRTLSPQLSELVEWIDWSPFFHAWEISGIFP